MKLGGGGGEGEEVRVEGEQGPQRYELQGWGKKRVDE